MREGNVLGATIVTSVNGVDGAGQYGVEDSSCLPAATFLVNFTSAALEIGSMKSLCLDFELLGVRHQDAA